MGNPLWLPGQIEGRTIARNYSPVGVYLPVDEVFPELEATENALVSILATLSRTDVLITCARLNLIISNPTNLEPLNKLRYCLANYFSLEEQKKIAAFFAEHNGPPTIFFRAQLLELMRWACRHCKDQPGDGSTFDNPSVRRNFAQAALIVADLWGQRTYEHRFDLTNGVEAARLTALGSTRIAYEATSTGSDPMMAIGRGHSLFTKHLPSIRTSFISEFHDAIGLALDDYFAMLATIAIHYLNRTPEMVVESNNKCGIFQLHLFENLTPRLASVANRYFELAAQSADSLCESLWSAPLKRGEEHLSWHDFKAIRERPILRTADGRAIVLDQVFFAESASVGPLFVVLQKLRDKDRELLLGQFGDAFELYANSVLRRMYPVPEGRIVNRLTCNVEGHDTKGNAVQIADACLNDVSEIALFETKATWIRDDLVEDRDFTKYVGALRSKYSRHANGRPKGVGQLANSIAKLASREWAPTKEDFSKAKRIYPILLVHDSRLEGVAHPNILAGEFCSALAPESVTSSGEMLKGKFAVAPLVVLTIDLLETLERSVEHFGFMELLRAYSEASPDRMMGLNNFIATTDFRKKLYASGSLAESALDVLANAEQLLEKEEVN